MRGPITCEKCGAIDILTKSKTFPEGLWSPGCGCLSKSFDKERAADHEDVISKIHQRMKSDRGVLDIIPPVHRFNLLDPDVVRISKDIFHVADNWEEYKSTNLLLAGPSRTGKSFDLAWLMNTLNGKGKFRLADDFWWGSVKGMCEAICGQGMDYDFFENCRILVLDDIMVHGNEGSMLFEAVNRRTNLADRPVWMTSNLTPAKLEEKLGNTALVNRLFQVDESNGIPGYKLVVKA